jgi:2-polyprenyl-3-methyl-5-hydroxy-6-metoxy-1,4-benzoquinol methylase
MEYNTSRLNTTFVKTITLNKQKKIQFECPLCKNTKGIILYTLSSDLAARHFEQASWPKTNKKKLTQLAHHIHTLWRQDTCTVVRCARCNFCSPVPYVAGDGHFYDLSEGGCNCYPKDRWEFNLTAKVLLQENHHIFPLLEIGAGSGEFIKQIPSLTDHVKEIDCLEYYTPAVKILRKKGVQVFQEDVRQLAQKKKFRNKYSTVCAFQVAEHVHDPLAFFAAVNIVTAPKANIFISVPNGRRIDLNEDSGSLRDTPPNHVGRFYPNNFYLIAKKMNWKVEKISIQPQNPLRILIGTYIYRRAQDNILQRKNSALLSLISILPAFLMTLQKREQLGTTIFVHFSKNS